MRVDGKVIAKNWNDLIDGLSPGAAAMNEYGILLTEVFNLRVWTALNGNGGTLTDTASKTCNFWTLDGDSFLGAYGRADQGGFSWSRWISFGEDAIQGCHKDAHIYCVQVHCDVHPEYCEPGYCAP